MLRWTPVVAGLAWFVIGLGIGIYAWWVEGRRRPPDLARLVWWWRVCIVYDVACTALTFPVVLLTTPNLPRGAIWGIAATIYTMGIAAFPLLMFRLYLPVAGGSIPRNEYVRFAAHYAGYTIAIALGGMIPLVALAAARVGP